MVLVPFDKLPLGKAPVLEITDETGTWLLSQTVAIVRYLADRYGLMGKNSKENAQCDEIALVVQELLEIMVPVYYQDDEELKKTTWKRFEEKEYPMIFGELEKRLVANGGEFMVGKQLTCADFIINWITNLMKDYVTSTASFIDEQYPNLKKLSDRIDSIPAIANHIKTRPFSDR